MKQLFNFYLEEEDKLKASEKLIRLNGKQNKGQLAALLRVLLKQFILTPDDKIARELLETIDAEYVYNTIKNKRSSL